MIEAGQTVLFRFPQTDQGRAKLRPALVLAQLPGWHDDWLICMISTQMHQAVPDFDETLTEDDRDFAESGLKKPSVIRLGRIAVVDARTPLGTMGNITPERLSRIRLRLSDWLRNV